MLDKLNITDIVKDHCGTLKNGGSDCLSKFDLLVFFGLPLIFAVWVVWMGFSIDKDFVNIVITALSILVGLLLNLLVIIYDVVNNKEKNVLVQEVLRQTFSNISFTILISLVAIAMLLAPYFINFSKVVSNLSYLAMLREAYKVVIVFLITTFGLHLMMILKRVHLLLRRETKSI